MNGDDEWIKNILEKTDFTKMITYRGNGRLSNNSNSINKHNINNKDNNLNNNNLTKNKLTIK